MRAQEVYESIPEIQENSNQSVELLIRFSYCLDFQALSGKLITIKKDTINIEIFDCDNLIQSYCSIKNRDRDEYKTSTIFKNRKFNIIISCQKIPEKNKIHEILHLPTSDPRAKIQIFSPSHLSSPNSTYLLIYRCSLGILVYFLFIIYVVITIQKASTQSPHYLVCNIEEAIESTQINNSSEIEEMKKKQNFIQNTKK